GIPIIPISGGPIETIKHRDHALLVSLGAPIKSGSDLKGKKVAINSRRNIDHLMMLLYLKKFGLTESDVELIEVPFPRMEAAVTTGSVDAIATAEPFITLALDRERLRLLDWNYVAVRPMTFVSTYVVTEDFAKKNPKIVKAFSQVLGKAAEVANTDPKRARASLSSYTKITPEVADKVGLPFFAPRMDIENMTETEKLLLQTGLLERPVNVKKSFEAKQGGL
ncbi:MAG: ABC transporter substrate-binding protein, partial [Nitrososphaeraceae archaeon]